MVLEKTGTFPDATLSDRAAVFVGIAAIVLTIFGIALNGFYISLIYGAWIMMPIFAITMVGIGWKSLKKNPLDPCHYTQLQLSFASL